jgi:hypothetical protein
MLNVALPPDNIPVPMVVPASTNATVPVAADGVTVAVKVTGLPYNDGLIDDETSVDVVDRPTLKLPEPVLPWKIP